MSTSFETALGELGAAINANNNSELFYQGLPGTLGEINRQLQSITDRIRVIKADLDQKTGEVEVNNQRLAGFDTQMSDMAKHNSELQSEKEAIQRERDELKGKIDELQLQMEKNTTSLDKEIRELNRQHEENMVKQAAAKDKLTLEELKKKDDAIAAEKSRLEQEMKTLQDRYNTQITELNAEKNRLDAEYQTINTERLNLKTQKEGLDVMVKELRNRNAELEQQLNDATGVMNEATRLLNAMPTSQPEIRENLNTLRGYIDKINQILDSESEFVDARESELPGNTIITQTYTSSGRTIEKTFTLKALLDAAIKADIKEKDKPDLINALQNADSVEIIKRIFNTLTSGQLATILDRVVETRGGRKTRRIKKHGRKTKKQRGGFKYNTNARRTSITTTRRSSSRRTSRRTSTTSSR